MNTQGSACHIAAAARHRAVRGCRVLSEGRRIRLRYGAAGCAKNNSREKWCGKGAPLGRQQPWRDASVEGSLRPAGNFPKKKLGEKSPQFTAICVDCGILWTGRGVITVHRAKRALQRALESAPYTRIASGEQLLRRGIDTLCHVRA
jgi:hypothetical protein